MLWGPIFDAPGIESFGAPGTENINFWCSGDRNMEFWCPGDRKYSVLVLPSFLQGTTPPDNPEGGLAIVHGRYGAPVHDVSSRLEDNPPSDGDYE